MNCQFVKPSIAVALLVGAAMPALCSAQLEQPIAAGARMRLTYRPINPDVVERKIEPVIAHFARFHADTVYAVIPTTGDTGTFALRHLKRVEVSTGRYHPTLKASLIGTLAGAAIGGVYGYYRVAAPATLCTTAACPYVPSQSRMRGGLQVGSIGAVLGLATGLFIGAQVITDRWALVDFTGDLRPASRSP